MSQQVLETIADALVAELAAVMGSLLDADATSKPLADGVEPAWAVGCRLDAPIVGRFNLGIPKADAAALAARLLMSDSEPADADVVDALAEIGGQAFAALVTKGTVAGLAGAIERPQPIDAQSTTSVAAFECVVDAALTARIVCWFEAQQDRAAGGATSAQAAPPVALPVPVVAAALASIGPGPLAVPDNLEVILDIDMPLSVRFGEAVLSLDLLTRLGPGSLIELSRQPDDPVDVLINGRLVARGEVVVVSGNYGVRITEVVSAAERLRSIGA